MSLVNVLVVEDEPAISELIAVTLRHGGYNPVCVDSAEKGQRTVAGVLPDLVLLDWMLPGQSGLQFAKALRTDARTKTIPIIMLTARSDENEKVAALDAGADDYVVKPFSSKELLARIRAVLRRRAPELTDDPVLVGPIVLNPQTHRVTSKGVEGKEQEIKLGPTEFRLLHYLMTHPERVHTRAQLLDQVWGDHVFIEERTVDVHIKRLREALAVACVEDHIETVRGAGYRFSARSLNAV